MACLGVAILTPDTLLMRWSGLDGWTMMAWRGLLEASVLLGVTLIWAPAALRAPLTRNGWPVALALGLSSICFALAVHATAVALVLLTLAMTPLLAALVSRWVLGERTRPLTWVWMLLAVAGLAVALGDTPTWQGAVGSPWLGVAFGLGAATSLATGLVRARQTPDLPMLPLTGSGALLAGLTGLLFADTLTPPTLAWGPTLAMGLLVLPLSFALITRAPRYTAAANVSLIMLLETVIGPLWVWWGVGEQISHGMWVGGAITLVAIALHLLTAARRQSRLSVKIDG
jgi:drug/metabolite transporter (DMT)-like permease